MGAANGILMVASRTSRDRTRARLRRHLDDEPPEVDSWNFAPRVHIPVLMLNGRDDFIFPVETNQKPLFRAFGTKAPDKKHVLDHGGPPQSGNAP